MKGQNPLETVHQTFLDELGRTTGERLLGGLEQQSHPDRQIELAEGNGDAEGDSSVPVVPTGMHPPGVLRTRGIPLRLVDGQGVEIGPEADPGLGADVHPETCLRSSVVIDDPVLIE